MNELRARRMEELGVARFAEPGDALRSGRILCCGVNASLDDRACHQVSKGFLDPDDLPPCDTWFGVVSMEFPHLLAWVPPAHVADVDAAIPYCPTEAYCWLSSVDRRLEQGLLHGS